MADDRKRRQGIRQGEGGAQESNYQQAPSRDMDDDKSMKRQHGSHEERYQDRNRQSGGGQKGQKDWSDQESMKH